MATNRTVVGQRMRWIHKKHGVTLKKLGDAVGVSASYLGHVELGKKGVPDTTPTRPPGPPS